MIGDVADITAGPRRRFRLPAGRTDTVWLDAGHLNEQDLGGLDIATSGTITVESDLTLADGGAVNFVAPVVDIKADVTARSGSVTATNQLVTREPQGTSIFTSVTDLLGRSSSLTLRTGATIDTRGVWTNALLDRDNLQGLAFVDGGNVTLARRAT